MIDTNYLRQLTEIDEAEWYTPGQEYLDALNDAADEIDRLRGDVKLWKPMTLEEAEAAFDAAIPVPISDDDISLLVARAIDPAWRPTEPEHVLMAAKIQQLQADVLRTMLSSGDLKAMCVKAVQRIHKIPFSDWGEADFLAEVLFEEFAPALVEQTTDNGGAS